MNKSSNSTKPNSRYQKPLVIVNLDIGQKIIIYEGDDIRDIVENFCQDNDLDLRCIDYLLQNINQQLLQKTQQKPHPPSFGTREDFMQASFGKPKYEDDLQSPQSEQASNLTTNQSLTEKNDTQIASRYQSLNEKNETQVASRYENWHQILSEKQNKKSISPRPKPSPRPNKNHTNPNNIFDKLYQKGVDQLKNRQESQKLSMRQKSENELLQATFKPMISQRSKILAQNRGRQDGTQPSKTQCQTPKSSKSPHTLKTHNTSINSSYLNDLHQTERKKSQWTGDSQNSQVTPKRSTSRTSNNQNYKLQQEAVKRLMMDTKDRVQNQNQQKNKINHQKKESDRVVNNTTKKQTNGGQSISETSQIKQNCSFSKLLKSDAKQYNISLNSSKNSGISDFERATKKVFDLLDEDGDGLISATNVDLSLIDGSILDLIAEVLYRMEDEGSVYNWQKFMSTCAAYGIQESLIRQATLPGPFGSNKKLF